MEKGGQDDRFLARREERRYNIKVLWERHQEILRRVVVGQTNGQIAQELGCVPQTVSNVRNSPLAQAEITRLSAARDEDTMEIARRIEEFVPTALQLVEDLVAGRIPEASISLRARHAEKYLGRAGYGEVHKVHSLTRHMISRSEIEEIKERAMSAAQRAGVIDVQGTTV